MQANSDDYVVQVVYDEDGDIVQNGGDDDDEDVHVVDDGVDDVQGDDDDGASWMSSRAQHIKLNLLIAPA